MHRIHQFIVYNKTMTGAAEISLQFLWEMYQHNQS